MGIIQDRAYVENKFAIFCSHLGKSYQKLANQKCPTIASKLPFIRQGVTCHLVCGKDIFIVFSKYPKLHPYSFVGGHFIGGSWDESENPRLSKADCIEDIVEILELEEVIYYKRLESLEPEYLDSELSEKSAKDLAGKLLEEHLQALKPSLQDAIDRMSQAYQLLFRLENELRMLIENKLKERFGDDWWVKGATHTARDRFTRRQKDPRRKWHLLEDTSPLNFVDFEDLHDIIVNKNSDLFEKCLGPIDRFSVNMKTLEIPRHLIAHNNLLPLEEFYYFRRTVESLLKLIGSNSV